MLEDLAAAGERLRGQETSDSNIKSRLAGRPSTSMQASWPGDRQQQGWAYGWLTGLGK